MKHKCLFISIMLTISPFISLAQTSLPTYKFPYEQGDSAIVREYGKEYTLIYAQPKASLGRFYLVDNNATALCFDLPSGMLVRDFEIMGDTAYFCGLDRSGAIFGNFDIGGTFGGVTPIYYANLNSWIDTNDTMMRIDSLQRMDLFRSGALVVMAMIGRSQLYKSESVPWQRTTVVGAVMLPTIYVLCASFEKDGLTWYTDVACLDGMVVAVGCDSNGTGQYAKAYDNSSGYAFPSTTVFQHNHIVPSLTTSGRVLVTRTDATTAACLQLSDKPTTLLTDLSFSTTSLATQNGPALYPYPFASLNINKWWLGEVRYNRSDKIVYAVERGCLPSGSTLDNLLLHYPYGIAGSSPITYGLLGWQSSLDIDHAGRVSLAGEYTSLLDLYHRKTMPMAPDDCSHYDSYDYYKDSLTILSASTESSHKMHFNIPNSFMPKVHEAIMEIKCE